MLVHICCSVDSHFFIQKLKEDFPGELLVGFFYDPNIHPYSEYQLRLQDAKYSCDILGIELIEGKYDVQGWLQKVRGLENEPEKGDRCTVCFDDRLEVSAKKAAELGHSSFTTTLLVSPKKSQEKLEIIGNQLGSEHNLNFIFKDYRSGNGVVYQGEAVKQNKLYRQDYCGCMFALIAQRGYQDRLLDELMSPISKHILPNSIEQRLDFFANRTQDTRFTKNAFLNYRLLFAKVVRSKVTIPSYFLAYSHLPKNSSKCRVEFEINNIFYANKDGIKFISISTFNALAKTNFINVTELYFNAPAFEIEIALRTQICKNNFDVSPIIVLDFVALENYEVLLESKIYNDMIIQKL